MLDEQRRTIIAEYSEKVLHHELLAAHAEQDRKILQEKLLRQQQDFREVHQQDLMKQKELQKFQNSTFDEFAQKKFIEDQKIIMELSGRLQELQNEVNCMNDSRDFRDAESICSGNSHVTSPPGLFPRHPPFEGLLKPAFISQRQTEEPPNIRDTSGISGNVFAHPQTSSSAPKDSVIFSGGDSSKNYGADQQRLQISDLHFDKFPTPATFACWKIRFKTEVCTCSQFPTEAMQWIKEVELVDSVDELRSSSSIRGISMPNFEVLDARIASALNKIIHNSHFKRKISLEEQKAQKEDRFLRGRQIAYLIYEQFRVTGTDDSVENYTDLFTIVLRNDDIQEFDSKWDGILLSMTKIPHDDILEGLYKLRIRESEKLKTVLELYDLETGQDAAEFVLRFGAATHHLDLSHVAAGLSGDAGRADGTCEEKTSAHGDRTDDTRLPMGCGTACGALARPAAGGDDSQRRPKRSGQSFHLAESRCAAAASAYMQDGASCRMRFDDRNGNMENMEKARKRRKRLEACTWPSSCSLEYVLFRASPSGVQSAVSGSTCLLSSKTDSIWRPWRVPVPRFGLGSLPNPQVVKPSSVGQTAARTLGLVHARD